MNYTKTMNKPIHVVDVDSGEITDVKSLKDKAYKVVSKEIKEEIINYTRWITEYRYIKVIATQQKLLL